MTASRRQERGPEGGHCATLRNVDAGCVFADFFTQSGNPPRELIPVLIAAFSFIATLLRLVPITGT